MVRIENSSYLQHKKFRELQIFNKKLKNTLQTQCIGHILLSSTFLIRKAMALMMVIYINKSEHISLSGNSYMDNLAT